MKYRSIKRGELLPEDTEILLDSKWSPYYDEIVQFKKGNPHVNWCLPKGTFRVPIKSTPKQKPHTGMKPQTQKIFDHLIVPGHTLTSLQAVYSFRCISLAKRICEIKHYLRTVVPKSGLYVHKEQLTTNTKKHIIVYSIRKGH
jgi:hypothetical protein